MADWIKHSTFADGDTREFEVIGHTGGVVIASTPYEYEGRQNPQWTIKVRQLPDGEETSIQASRTMYAALKGLESRLGVGGRFALTRVSRGLWEAVLQEGGKAPSAANAGPTAQRKGGYGGASDHPEAGASPRYDKYSSPCLTRTQIEALSEWAVTQTHLVSAALGIPGKEGTTAALELYERHLNLAVYCGIPTEFADGLADRGALAETIKGTVMEANIKLSSMTEFLKERFDCEVSELPTVELQKIVADLDGFLAGYRKWAGNDDIPL